MDPQTLLATLNSEQRAAALQVRGPVAILAGAGTGKTTTVTHRIAWQVLSGEFTAREVLAVTFTDKAANELRQRLQRLGVRGVEARTFHSAARWMLAVLWQHYTQQPMPDLMPHKIVLLEDMVRALPAPDCFRPRREIAQEIEWAKHQRISPEQYLDAIARSGHEQPLRDPERMQRIYAGYEAEKARRGVWDFEDLLVKLADLLDAHPDAAERLRARFRAITVDEYQDVNPLQQALLDHWTAGTNDICVVGDDYQTIYAFTGASASYLLEFQQRHPSAHVLRLETSYRSTQRVLDLANRLVPKLGGSEKVLRAASPDDADAPAPHFDQHVSRAAEAAFVARECRRLHTELGVPWRDMAVLYRINARSPEFEAALAAADVPFIVRSGAFLDRPGARGTLRQLDRRRHVSAVQDEVTRAAERVGWRPGGTTKASDEAQTLQEDLGRLVEIAGEREWSSVGEFLDAVRAQFAHHETTEGVELSTIHRAKGLEWEAVFLPRLNAGELPFASRTSSSDLDDERRLLYVGLTRAKRHLYATCATDAGAPSEFLVELGLVDAAAVRSSRKRASSGGASVQLDESDPLTAELRRWRSDVSTSVGKPAYTVFDNKTLAEIAHAKPRSLGALLAVKGVGEAKLERYGDDVVELVLAHSSN
jgi:DNA helicase-2/ATP-dependent DNA helicase PcrA